jgi:hypothetical protein
MNRYGLKHSSQQLCELTTPENSVKVYRTIMHTVQLIVNSVQIIAIQSLSSTYRKLTGKGYRRKRH